MDSGRFTRLQYNSNKETDSLVVNNVSKNIAISRLDFMTKVSGTCHRFYSLDTYNAFHEFEHPDMKCRDQKMTILYLMQFKLLQAHYLKFY